MANEFVKAEQVIAQMLGVLERDSVLAQFTWRDLQADRFRGAKNDTVTLKVPAYTTARTRTMRAAAPIILDDLTETSVDVKLDTHVYKAIRVTDEEMTLDITNFAEQVTAPAMSSVVRKVDDTIGAAMAAASPEVSIAVDPDDVVPALFEAQVALFRHAVPPTQRFLAVGTAFALAMQTDNRLLNANTAGSNEQLRTGQLPPIAGFQPVIVPGLDPDIAIAAHRTAFPLALVAPEVPMGASWGEKRTWRGLQLRTLRDYDPTDANGPADRLLTDTFMGVGVTEDSGTLDEDGNFQPSVDGDDEPILVRAIELHLSGS